MKNFFQRIHDSHPGTRKPAPNDPVATNQVILPSRQAEDIGHQRLPPEVIGKAPGIRRIVDYKESPGRTPRPPHTNSEQSGYNFATVPGAGKSYYSNAHTRMVNITPSLAPSQSHLPFGGLGFPSQSREEKISRHAGKPSKLPPPLVIETNPPIALHTKDGSHRNRKYEYDKQHALVNADSDVSTLRDRTKAHAENPEYRDREIRSHENRESARATEKRRGRERAADGERWRRNEHRSAAEGDRHGSKERGVGEHDGEKKKDRGERRKWEQEEPRRQKRDYKERNDREGEAREEGKGERGKDKDWGRDRGQDIQDRGRDRNSERVGEWGPKGGEGPWNAMGGEKAQQQRNNATIDMPENMGKYSSKRRDRTKEVAEAGHSERSSRQRDQQRPTKDNSWAQEKFRTREESSDVYLNRRQEQDRDAFLIRTRSKNMGGDQARRREMTNEYRYHNAETDTERHRQYKTHHNVHEPDYDKYNYLDRRHEPGRENMERIPGVIPHPQQRIPVPKPDDENVSDSSLQELPAVAKYKQHRTEGGESVLTQAQFGYSTARSLSSEPASVLLRQPALTLNSSEIQIGAIDVNLSAIPARRKDSIIDHVSQESPDNPVAVVQRSVSDAEGTRRKEYPRKQRGPALSSEQPSRAPSIDVASIHQVQKESHNRNESVSDPEAHQQPLKSSSRWPFFKRKAPSRKTFPSNSTAFDVPDDIMKSQERTGAGDGSAPVYMSKEVRPHENATTRALAPPVVRLPLSPGPASSRRPTLQEVQRSSQSVGTHASLNHFDATSSKGQFPVHGLSKHVHIHSKNALSATPKNPYLSSDSTAPSLEPISFAAAAPFINGNPPPFHGASTSALPSEKPHVTSAHLYGTPKGFIQEFPSIAVPHMLSQTPSGQTSHKKYRTMGFARSKDAAHTRGTTTNPTTLKNGWSGDVLRSTTTIETGASATPEKPALGTHMHGPSSTTSLTMSQPPRGPPSPNDLPLPNPPNNPYHQQPRQHEDGQSPRSRTPLLDRSSQRRNGELLTHLTELEQPYYRYENSLQNHPVMATMESQPQPPTLPVSPGQGPKQTYASVAPGLHVATLPETQVNTRVTAPELNVSSPSVGIPRSNGFTHGNGDLRSQSRQHSHSFVNLPIPVGHEITASTIGKAPRSELGSHLPRPSTAMSYRPTANEHYITSAGVLGPPITSTGTSFKLPRQASLESVTNLVSSIQHPATALGSKLHRIDKSRHLQPLPGEVRQQSRPVIPGLTLQVPNTSTANNGHLVSSQTRTIISGPSIPNAKSESHTRSYDKRPIYTNANGSNSLPAHILEATGTTNPHLTQRGLWAETSATTDHRNLDRTNNLELHESSTVTVPLRTVGEQGIIFEQSQSRKLVVNHDTMIADKKDKSKHTQFIPEANFTQHNVLSEGSQKELLGQSVSVNASHRDPLHSKKDDNRSRPLASTRRFHLPIQHAKLAELLSSPSPIHSVDVSGPVASTSVGMSYSTTDFRSDQAISTGSSTVLPHTQASINASKAHYSPPKAGNNVDINTATSSAHSAERHYSQSGQGAGYQQSAMDLADAQNLHSLTIPRISQSKTTSTGFLGNHPASHSLSHGMTTLHTSGQVHHIHPGVQGVPQDAAHPPNREHVRLARQSAPATQPLAHLPQSSVSRGYPPELTQHSQRIESSRARSDVTMHRNHQIASQLESIKSPHVTYTSLSIPPSAPSDHLQLKEGVPASNILNSTNNSDPTTPTRGVVRHEDGQTSNPIHPIAPTLKTHRVSNEVSRRASEDSILLKTPSSLALSMLKPTISRTSIPASVSSQTSRKRGLFSLFRSKTSQPPSDTEEAQGSSSGHLKKASKMKPWGSREDVFAQDFKLASSLPSLATPPVSIPVNTSSDRKVFTPFRYLTSKRNRAMSVASVEAQDGTAANTVVGSPTASMHSTQPPSMQPPPLRDPFIATQEWRDLEAAEVRAATGGKLRRARPGVVFDVAEDVMEEKRRPMRSKGQSRSG